MGSCASCKWTRLCPVKNDQLENEGCLEEWQEELNCPRMILVVYFMSVMSSSMQSRWYQDPNGTKLKFPIQQAFALTWFYLILKQDIACFQDTSPLAHYFSILLFFTYYLLKTPWPMEKYPTVLRAVPRGTIYQDKKSPSHQVLPIIWQIPVLIHWTGF